MKNNFKKISIMIWIVGFSASFTSAQSFDIFRSLRLGPSLSNFISPVNSVLNETPGRNGDTGSPLSRPLSAKTCPSDASLKYRLVPGKCVAYRQEDNFQTKINIANLNTSNQTTAEKECQDLVCGCSSQSACKTVTTGDFRISPEFANCVKRGGTVNYNIQSTCTICPK